MGDANSGLIAQGIPRWRGATYETLTAVASALNSFGVGDMTFVGNAGNRDIVTIDGVPYILQTGLSSGATSVNEVLIGGTAGTTADNLIAAINGDAGAGTIYGEHMKPHPTVTAADGGGTIVDIIARAFGAAGNGIVVTTDVTGATVGNTAGGTDAAGFTVPEGATSCIITGDMAEAFDWAASPDGLDATGPLKVPEEGRLQLIVESGDRIYVFAGTSAILHATYFYG